MYDRCPHPGCLHHPWHGQACRAVTCAAAWGHPAKDLSLPDVVAQGDRMTINPPLWARTLLYLVAAIAEPTRKLLVDEHLIDTHVDAYVSALIALVMLMAVGNGVAQVAKTTAARRSRAHR